MRLLIRLQRQGCSHDHAEPLGGSTSASAHHAAVVGAGYAGVIAANRLLSSRSRGERDLLRVTRLNPRPDFVQRIRLHEVAAGTIGSAAFPLVDVLHREVDLAIRDGRVVELATVVNPGKLTRWNQAAPSGPVIG